MESDMTRFNKKRELKYNPVPTEELPEVMHRKQKERHQAKLRRLQRIRKSKTSDGDIKS